VPDEQVLQPGDLPAQEMVSLHAELEGDHCTELDSQELTDCQHQNN